MLASGLESQKRMITWHRNGLSCCSNQRAFCESCIKEVFFLFFLFSINLFFPFVICQHGATLEMSWRARARWRRLSRRTEMPCITAATWPTCCITCESVFYHISCDVVHIFLTLNARLPLASFSIRLCQSVCLWGFCARLSSECVSTHGCSNDIRLCAEQVNDFSAYVRASIDQSSPLRGSACCLVLPRVLSVWQDY